MSRFSDHLVIGSQTRCREAGGAVHFQLIAPISDIVLYEVDGVITSAVEYITDHASVLHGCGA